MAKYRLLTHEELNEFKDEFIDYLVVNGITSEEWGKIKEERPKDAIKIINLFSDVVFEAVTRKIKFLEVRTAHEVQCFQCLEKQLVKVAMRIDPSAGIDLTKPEDLGKAMEQPPGNIEVYSASKNYENEREMDLFLMTESGAKITDGELFKALSLALAESKQGT